MWKLVADHLDIAEALAKIDSRRPRQASLRRAVATAYYALFQSLAEMCADVLVGWGQPWEIFTPIYRSLDHGRMLAVLSERSVDKKHPLGEPIERIGVAFKELQAAREWADYSPEPHPDPPQTSAGVSFSRADAQELLSLAREAIDMIDRLDRSTRLKLAARLVTRSRRDTRK